VDTRSPGGREAKPTLTAPPCRNFSASHSSIEVIFGQ